jgi:succinate dehydrogenase / fumarate reductase iron-sulfur subunit
MYSIPIIKGMTVLDALIYAKEKSDPSISFRHSCRMGNCGSCGMIINGSPKLACQTQVSNFGGKIIEVKPLENFPVIRDLVCDFDEFLNKHHIIKPYLIKSNPKEVGISLSESIQTPQKIDEFIQFSMCIKCGLCFHACPISSTNKKYLGPQALSQVYRYLADSRDDDKYERIKIVDARHGCWSCHIAGSCSEACPKGVDPSLGIQRLKRHIISHVKRI